MSELALRTIRRIALAGVLLAVVVVVLGAFTRLVHAGLGCPDWPGCYGHLLWPDTAEEIARADLAFPDMPVDLDKTWPEMVHRYVAGTLLLLVLGLTVVSQRNKAGLAGSPIPKLSVILLALIILQAAFGAWTVTLKLWPQVVTAHLLGGFATLSMLWAIFLLAGGAPTLGLTRATRERIGFWAKLALAVTIVQIALGGWVSSNYAALACTDFPTCFGSYAPSMKWLDGFNIFQSVGPNYLGGQLESEARVAIHWTHRLGALVVLAVVGVLSIKLLLAHRGLAFGLVAILLLQILLGSLNVVWALPLWVATLHNAVGAMLLLALVTVNFAPARESQQLIRDSLHQR